MLEHLEKLIFLILIVSIFILKRSIKTSKNIWKVYFGKENAFHYSVHWFFYIFCVSLVPAFIRIAVYYFSLNPTIKWINSGDITICALTLSALTFQNLSLVKFEESLKNSTEFISLPKYIDCIQILTGTIIILSAGLLFYQFLIDNEYLIKDTINVEAHYPLIGIIFILSIPLSYLSGLFQRNFSK